MVDTLSNKSLFAVCEKKKTDVFSGKLTHTILLSFSSPLFRQPFPCPRGAKHTKRVSPGSNLLTLPAKDSSKHGEGERRKCFILFIQALCPMESSKEVTLGQLVGEATHATAQ